MDKIISHIESIVGCAPKIIIQDGRIHRFGDKKCCWYVSFPKSEATVFGSWKQPGTRHTFFKNGSYEELSEDDMAMLQKEMKDHNALREKRKERNAALIKNFYKRLKQCHAHPYADKKQISINKNVKEVNSRKRHLLVVPVYNIKGDITGAHCIYPNGNKRFVKNSVIKEGFTVIGEESLSSIIYITEGFATGQTVHSVTGSMVFVAFTLSNILSTTSYLKRKYSKKRIIIAADNDRWNKNGNVGLEAAKKAADACCCEYRIPQFISLDSRPTDFNDLYCREGAETVLLYLDALTENGSTSEDADLIDCSEKETEKEEAPIHQNYFRCLGFDANSYYFLPRNTQKVTRITVGNMSSKASLISLAPLDWWNQVFFAGQKPDWTIATDYLMRQQEKKGAFSSENVRGIGAWYDAGRSVLHLGKKLIVDGRIMDLKDIETNYIYEMSASMMGYTSTAIMSNSQAEEIYNIFGLLNFKNPSDAMLMAGWSLLAPICGALSWRPHIWITGSRGSGKSYIMSSIISAIIGDIALEVQSSVTEAGIRQTLQSDSRPVLFDEAEEDERGGRMQSIIALARASSSNKGSNIIKGSPQGDTKSYKMRSMFAFGSINVPITQASDASRISILQLVPNTKGKASTEKFAKIKKKVKEVLSESNTSSLRSRVHNMIPVIRQNAAIFSSIIGEKMHCQRTGDQIGTLMAGAYAYHSTDVISEKTANQWVNLIQMESSEDSAGSIRDEYAVLHQLMESTIRVETAIGTSHTDRSVIECVKMVSEGKNTADIVVKDADVALQRNGMRVLSGNLYISISSSKIKSMLKETAYRSKWHHVLSRCDGATDDMANIRMLGITHRCVGIDVLCIVGEEQ